MSKSLTTTHPANRLPIFGMSRLTVASRNTGPSKHITWQSSWA